VERGRERVIERVSREQSCYERIEGSGVVSEEMNGSGGGAASLCMHGCGGWGNTNIDQID
jgi:hypothetical protein